MQPSALRRALLVAGIALFFRAYAEAPAMPGISGLAKLEDGVYLAVHDTKVAKDKDADPASEAPRATILDLTDPEKLIATTADIDWSQLKGGRSNDLEAVCSIEGVPGEFVAVESGHVGPDFGRIIHLKAEKAEGKWKFSILGFTTLPNELPDNSACKDIEGAQTFIRGGDTYLLLGKRGKDDKKGRLIWGKLNWNKPLFKVEGDEKFYTNLQKLNLPGEKRYCSDILIKNGDIYVSSTNDPGDDGPFTSAVYHLGNIVPTGASVLHLNNHEQMEITRYDGHKVEALAAPLKADGLWLAGTDDENAGGSVFITTQP